MEENKSNGHEMESWNLLPNCGKEAENLDIILACFFQRKEFYGPLHAQG